MRQLAGRQAGAAALAADGLLEPLGQLFEGRARRGQLGGQALVLAGQAVDAFRQRADLLSGFSREVGCVGAAAPGAGRLQAQGSLRELGR